MFFASFAVIILQDDIIVRDELQCALIRIDEVRFLLCLHSRLLVIVKKE